jgi:hypothetical protein
MRLVIGYLCGCERFKIFNVDEPPIENRPAAYGSTIPADIAGGHRSTMRRQTHVTVDAQHHHGRAVGHGIEDQM